MSKNRKWNQKNENSSKLSDIDELTKTNKTCSTNGDVSNHFTLTKNPNDIQECECYHNNKFEYEDKERHCNSIQSDIYLNDDNHITFSNLSMNISPHYIRIPVNILNDNSSKKIPKNQQVPLRLIKGNSQLHHKEYQENKKKHKEIKMIEDPFCSPGMSPHICQNSKEIQRNVYQCYDRLYPKSKINNQSNASTQLNSVQKNNDNIYKPEQRIENSSNCVPSINKKSITLTKKMSTFQEKLSQEIAKTKMKLKENSLKNLLRYYNRNRNRNSNNEFLAKTM